MSSGLSRLQLFNMVADHLEDAEIAAVTETSKLARAIRRWEPIVRDQLLRKMRPAFARVRVALSPMDVTPAFGWGYQHELPADCLAVYSIQYEGEWEGAQIPHEIEQGPNGKLVILSDESSTIYLRYIVREENTGRWEPLFCAAWAARTARMIAAKITNKKGMIETLMAIEKDAIGDAKFYDQIDGTAERAAADEWETQRNGAWG